MQKNNFQKDLTNAIYCVILCIVDKTKTDIWRNKNEKIHRRGTTGEDKQKISRYD